MTEWPIKRQNMSLTQKTNMSGSIYLQDKSDRQVTLRELVFTPSPLAFTDNLIVLD
jgi:hypothetical protein